MDKTSKKLYVYIYTKKKVNKKYNIPFQLDLILSNVHG